MPKLAGLIPAGVAALCIGHLASTAVYADPPGLLPAQPPVVVPVPASPRIDPEDRLLSGHLNPAAETRSRAAALYAEALGDDPSVSRDKTLEALRQVVTLDPHFADGQISLANALLQTGQMDEALAQLTTALASNPDSVSIAAALAYTHRMHGQNDEAVQLAKSVLARDPSQTMAMRVLLEVAGEQNDLSGAVLHIEDILKAGGADVPAADWLTLARLYLEVARSGSSPLGGDVISKTRLPILQEAASRPPPDVETLTLLGDTYRDLGRKAEALHTLRRALDLQPSDVDLLMDCASLESETGEKDAALKDYDTAYRLDPGLSGLCELLGRLDLAAGHDDDAVGLLQDAVAQSPLDAGLQLDLGMAYEGASRPDDAQKCYQQVFAELSCPPEAYLKLAFFQLARKEVKLAGQTLAAAEAHFPQSPQIRYYEAVQHRYEKNYDSALACLAAVRTLALAQSGNQLGPDFYLESALNLNLAGRTDQFQAVLREALGKFPDNPELMNELAYFWADHAMHLGEALTLSRRAAQLAPDNGPILDTLGWVYFQMGKPKDALPYLQRAAVLTNNDPMVLQHVGDARLKLGEPRAALTAWKRALAQAPKNGDLATRIDAVTAQANNAHSRPAPQP